MVGNELIVGAPGSSLSGPRDGVVYVFDVNAEGTTFGNLLATLTVPDPGKLGGAAFGAAVGSTDTNILVGAPGNANGTGEVYEFAGDTTQANFGSLLLDIANPTSQAASGFGAAVGGIGTNVIVGAPTVDLAGAIGGRLRVRRHDRSRDHLDRESDRCHDDRVWLGGRVGRCGYPDRIAGCQ